MTRPNASESCGVFDKRVTTERGTKGSENARVGRRAQIRMARCVPSEKEDAGGWKEVKPVCGSSGACRRAHHEAEVGSLLEWDMDLRL
jgi:hypothetical protein